LSALQLLGRPLLPPEVIEVELFEEFPATSSVTEKRLQMFVKLNGGLSCGGQFKRPVVD
jgi:hypothetical protein